MTTASVFWSGRSQAVRLPKEFRLGDERVNIRKEGNLIILEPIKKREWPKGYWEFVATTPHEDLEIPQDLLPRPFEL